MLITYPIDYVETLDGERGINELVPVVGGRDGLVRTRGLHVARCHVERATLQVGADGPTATI